MATYSPQFLACMPFVLQEEGGYTNDPNDSGGKTDYGILQREYDAWRHAQGLPARWVKKITPDEYDAIYWKNYWVAHCPMLPPGLDLTFFNICVNGGPGTAIYLLQEALRIPADHAWGPVTNRAVAAIQLPSVPALIRSFATDEENWYEGLSKFKYFGKDWIGRCKRCEVASLAMAQKGISS